MANSDHGDHHDARRQRDYDRHAERAQNERGVFDREPYSNRPISWLSDDDRDRNDGRRDRDDSPRDFDRFRNDRVEADSFEDSRRYDRLRNNSGYDRKYYNGDYDGSMRDDRSYGGIRDRDNDAQYDDRYEGLFREGDAESDTMRVYQGSPEQLNRAYDRGDGPHRGKGPKGYVRDNSAILEEAHERLTDCPDVDASEIQVVVENQEITLEGTVPERLMKRIAGRILDDIRGVKDVHNHLRLQDLGER